ncbi:MAG TPA: hypothetical protein DIW37_08285 [Chryseobacterium sp.]|nr:hypothetical protein [Chryseobacterium sp.]
MFGSSSDRLRKNGIFSEGIPNNSRRISGESYESIFASLYASAPLGGILTAKLSKKLLNQLLSEVFQMTETGSIPDFTDEFSGRDSFNGFYGS